MADTQIDVKFGGDAGDAQKAISAVTGALKDGVGNMNTSLQTLMSGVAKFKGAILGVTAVLAGGAMFKAAISEANTWNGEVTKISKSMGTSTQQASVMAVALNHIGLSSDTVTSATMMLSRNLNSNANAFKVLGIETKNTETGAFRPISEIMAEVNTRLGKIKNTTEQNVAGMQVYGRGWGEIKAILKLNSEEMAAAETRAKQLHLIVGPEGAAATKKYKEEQADLKLVARSLEVQMGNALLPVMVKLGSWFSENGPKSAEAFGWALDKVVVAIKSTTSAMGNLINSMRGWEAVAKGKLDISSFAKMDASGLQQWLDASSSGVGKLQTRLTEVRSKLSALSPEKNGISAEYSTLLEEARMLENAIASAKEVKAAGDKPAGDKPAAAYKDEHLDFSKGKEKAGGGAEKDTRFAQWKNQLEQMKEAEGNFFKTDLASDEAYWQSKLQLVQGNGEKEQQIRRQVQHEIYQIHKQMAVQRRAIDEEEIDRAKQRGDDEVAMEREKLRSMLELGQINDQQKITSELALANQEHQIDLAALDRKMAIYQQDQVAFAKLQSQKEQMLRKYNLDILKLENDAAAKQRETANKWLSPITSAISTSIQGMIQGTTTMKKALANIFQSILASYVDMVAKMAQEWAAGMLKNLMTTISTNASTTASTAASSDAQVVATAPVAAAKGASAMAGIPYVGPILAAAAFASLMAMILGSRGHAVGKWDVPSDMVTKIHKGEMIVPAEFADNVRNGGGLGGGGGDVHLHVSAIDAGGVRKFLRDNSPAVSEALRRQARNFTSTRT